MNEAHHPRPGATAHQRAVAAGKDLEFIVLQVKLDEIRLHVDTRVRVARAIA